ncbi:hypothetical protein ACH4S8_08030 [Streptomyces sp. NPDC021080]|uniref:hypothetical protein n=1 Tax=Streptomyces sp. NPDC021080 TaxID=3365110 RepID=UPI0037A27F23
MGWVGRVEGFGLDHGVQLGAVRMAGVVVHDDVQGGAQVLALLAQQVLQAGAVDRVAVVQQSEQQCGHVGEMALFRSPWWRCVPMR